MESKILVVDDEAVVRILIQRALARYPYRLINACDGLQALELARAEKPDLILLDIGLPGKDGHEVLQELRGDSETQTIPVMILTGHGGMVDKVSGFSGGADDYVTKPFDIAELQARIGSMLKRHSQEVCANPLTRLPGSPSIEEHVNRRLSQNAPFAFFHIDIDNFKAFNDTYGYAAGDSVIQETGRIILDSIKAYGGPEDFVGHIGGDDFIIVTQPQSTDDIALEIIQRFDQQSRVHYKPEDRTRGFVVTQNRQGHPQRFPLMTLSVAAAKHDKRKFRHYAELVDAVTEIKKYLKSRENFSQSVFLADRRES